MASVMRLWVWATIGGTCLSSEICDGGGTCADESALLQTHRRLQHERPSCCKAKTASCLACAKSITVEEYCAKAPRTEGCPDSIVDLPDLPEQRPDSGIEPIEPLQEERPCCKAMTASCFACKSGITVEEYCAIVPRSEGCPDFVVDLPEEEPEDERPCCKAMTADCLACKSSTTVEEYCARAPRTEGCPDLVVDLPEEEPEDERPCCEAMTANCLACKEGTTVEKFCARGQAPWLEGCPGPDSGVELRLLQEERPCCKAMTASCFACKSGITVEEYCAIVPRSEGCPDFVVDLPEQEQPICCHAMTASCLACKHRTTVEEVCATAPRTEGCPDRL